MTTLAHDAKDQLKSYLERIERVEEERRELGDDVRAIYADAKANGFDAKAIRSMVKRRRKDASEQAEEDVILETYMEAVGMTVTAPLAAAVAALAVDAMAREQVIDAFKMLVPVHGEIIAKVGGLPMRIWRDEAGNAHAAVHVDASAVPTEKAGRSLKRAATVLTMVPKADPVKTAADRAEERARSPSPSDEETDESEPVE